MKRAEEADANSSEPSEIRSTFTARKLPWTGMFAVVGLVLSVIALTQSCEQTSSAKKVPFESALYQTRVAAMQSFARAHFNLDNQLRATLADMPYDVYSPEALAMTKDWGMQQNAMIAQKFRDQYAAYVAENNANMGIWPEQIQDKLVDAGDLAAEASDCFIVLGGKTMNNGTYSLEQHRNHWALVRERAAVSCNNLNKTHEGEALNDKNPVVRFQNSGQGVLVAMGNALRKTQNDLVPGSGSDVPAVPN